MTTYGLTAQGFVPKTLETLVNEVNADLRFYFGPSLNLTSGVLARIVGIICERYAELWELGEAVNSAADPDKAASTALSAIGLITGAFRVEAIYSTVTLTLTGLNATVVPTGNRVTTSTASATFVTIAAGTLTTNLAWIASTVYALGARRTNATRIYQCILAGTSAASGGPTTAVTDITDGSAHWRYLGEGTASADVTAQATAKGVLIAVSGDLKTIVNPVGGWQSAINILDASVGFDDQSDESFRITREAELSQAGASTASAIRAAILQIAGVTSGTVFTNETDLTDVDGMPPHSVEALVRGGTNTDIGRVLLDNVAAGIQTRGSVAVSVLDTETVAHVMKFNRPAEQLVYVVLAITKDPTMYPPDGDDQVRAAIVAYGAAQVCGKNVVAARITAACFAVAGVLDVSVCNVGLAPAPGGNVTIAIALRQLAVYDTSRIAITTTDDAP